MKDKDTMSVWNRGILRQDVVALFTQTVPVRGVTGLQLRRGRLETGVHDAIAVHNLVSFTIH